MEVDNFRERFEQDPKPFSPSACKDTINSFSREFSEPATSFSLHQAQFIMAKSRSRWIRWKFHRIRREEERGGKVFKLQSILPFRRIFFFCLGSFVSLWIWKVFTRKVKRCCYVKFVRKTDIKLHYREIAGLSSFDFIEKLGNVVWACVRVRDFDVCLHAPARLDRGGSVLTQRVGKKRSGIL